MVLAFDCEEQDIQTVEGLSVGVDGHLHPLQEAWAQSGGSQCGFCTPGFLMTSKELLEKKTNPSREEIEIALSGNVCRCTGYQKIIDAVSLAASRMARQKSPSPSPQTGQSKHSLGEDHQ
jgi:carbon-monoxide dehydrogenase small subunit